MPICLTCFPFVNRGACFRKVDSMWERKVKRAWRKPGYCVHRAIQQEYEAFSTLGLNILGHSLGGYL